MGHSLYPHYISYVDSLMLSVCPDFLDFMYHHYYKEHTFSEMDLFQFMVKAWETPALLETDKFHEHSNSKEFKSVSKIF
jgi:hypothetical protein